MPHDLFFYEDTATLIQRVGDFAREGLAGDDVVVVVATPEHREAIAANLAESGFDPVAAVTCGRFVALDAAETLASLSVDGRPDAAGFETVVGGLVRETVATGRPLRIFGEMVALLWDAGDQVFAVELEALWHDLDSRETFNLLCAYAGDVLACGDNYAHVNDVCDLHGRIALSLKDSHPVRLRVIPAELSSVSRARHFVANCVGVGGTPEGRDDALLVTSELSANAVYHAKSAFVLELSWHDGVVRIGVRDAYCGRPKLRPHRPRRSTGRGVAMIDALATRWGVEPHVRGKTVWAELPV